MAIRSYRAEVAGNRALTPRIRRITVAGPGLAGFESRGLPDERVKLLLAQAGQDRPELPLADGRGFQFPAGTLPPTMRTFTLRRFDPDALELDVDIVTHHGVASGWSVTARAGDEVGIVGPAGGYACPSGCERLLLAGDETALPAISTILERLPAAATADVLVEIASQSAVLELPAADRARIAWLPASEEGTGVRLADAVRAFEWPPEPVAVWAAGETLSMRAIRAHLRDDLGLPRERVEVIGHWREQLTEDETAADQRRAIAAARAAGASDDELAVAGL